MLTVCVGARPNISNPSFFVMISEVPTSSRTSVLILAITCRSADIRHLLFRKSPESVALSLFSFPIPSAAEYSSLSLVAFTSRPEGSLM